MTTQTHISELKTLLADDGFDRATRLARLQGWRGENLSCAVLAGHAHRIAPAGCAAMAWGTVLSGSVPLALFAAATAVFGAFANNHPFEVLYNRWANRTSRHPLPANRAAKRLGCATGALFFIGAAVGFGTGHGTVGVLLTVMMGGLATFVAATNICVPSIAYTVGFGVDKATSPRLFGPPAASAQVKTQPV